MSVKPVLEQLAAVDAAAPFGFAEFERRRLVAGARQRRAAWGTAASMGILAVVSLAAVLTQPPAPQAELRVAQAPPAARAATRGAQQPALVDVWRFDLTSELEDHIAVLDAELSAARVGTSSSERVRQMERTREQLNDSLQRVSYAHDLLSL